MLRSILAVVLGLLLAFVLVFAMEAINFVSYPPPGGLDMKDHDQMRRYIDSLPLTAFLVVLAAYALGTLGGAWLAAKIGGPRPLVNGLVVGAFLLAASVMNIVSIPHPLWFVVLNLTMILPLAWFGSQLALPRRALA